jgi:hypothetical protein
MEPWNETSIWPGLSARARRAVVLAVEGAAGGWRYFRLTGPVGLDAVRAYARRPQLRAVFSRPSQVVTAVTGRLDGDAVVLGVRLTPHPANVRLPAWCVGLDASIRISFGPDVVVAPMGAVADPAGVTVVDAPPTPPRWSGEAGREPEGPQAQE